MVQAISDIKELVEEAAPEENPLGGTQPAQMLFSQIPGAKSQHAHSLPQSAAIGPSFGAQRDDFMQKLE